MSGFLLDTNIISELIKPEPAVNVVLWFQQTDENLMFLSVLTLGEIRKGISILPDARRRVKIEAWLKKDLCQRFEGRILQIDANIADRWGSMVGQAQIKKIVIPVIDGLLAATAMQYNLTLVTLNTRDVVEAGVGLFNPWQNK